MNWLTNIFTKHAANWLVFGAVIAGGSYHITSKLVKAESSQETILQAIEKQPDEIKKAVEASLLPRIEAIEAGQKEIKAGQESSKKVTRQIILEMHLNTQKTVELIEELSEKKNTSYNQ